MGLTFVDGVVTGAASRSRHVRFLVDSGASYTLLPEETWRAIGLEPKYRASFVLADGTEIERDISECHIALAEREGHTTVILGAPGDEPLFGIITLEMLGLILHPFNRTLQPARLRLARMVATTTTIGRSVVELLH